MEKSDNSESMALYIKERVRTHLNNISSFYQQTVSDQGAFMKIRQDIIDLKASKGPQGFKEASSKIKKMQEVHYNMFLMQQSITQHQVIVYELNVMAKAFGVELDIPKDEETQRYFETITSTNPFIFDVQNGKPAMVNTEMVEAAMGAMKEKVHSEESLRKVYESL